MLVVMNFSNPCVHKSRTSLIKSMSLGIICVAYGFMECISRTFLINGTLNWVKFDD